MPACRPGYLLATLAVVVAGCGRFGFNATGDDLPTIADGRTAGPPDAPPSELADAAVDGAVGPPDAQVPSGNLMFMTSQAFAADFGGIAGADALCQDAATTAGLPGSFGAVLFTASTTPSAHFAGARGWIDVHAELIADLPAELDDRNRIPVRFDEHGAPLGLITSAWFGGPGGSTCDDWTSTTQIMQPHALDPALSFATDVFGACGSPAHLVCAQRDRVVVLAPPDPPGRVLFVSMTAFAPGGGLEAADALCATDATTGGLAGSFKAYLATSAATADSRFSAAGLPWKRVDGELVTTTAAELVGPSPLAVWRTFMGRTALNEVTNARPWTGTASANCADWTAAGALGTHGEVNTAQRSNLQRFGASGCASPAPIICLQE